jgi:hypothetical protein
VKVKAQVWQEIDGEIDEEHADCLLVVYVTHQLNYHGMKRVWIHLALGVHTIL